MHASICLFSISKLMRGRPIWAPPIGRQATGCRAVCAPDIWAPLRAMKKNNEAGNSLNVVEREPVPTRVLVGLFFALKNGKIKEIKR